MPVRHLPHRHFFLSGYGQLSQLKPMTTTPRIKRHASPSRMASRFSFIMSIVSKNAFRCASLVCSSRRAPNSSCKARPCSMMGQAFSVQRSRVRRRSPGVSLADEAALLHQTVYVHRDEVCFQFAHLHHVAGGLVAGVVGEEHQDVKSRLGQMELLAQGLAEGGVSARSSARIRCPGYSWGASL